MALTADQKNNNTFFGKVVPRPGILDISPYVPGKSHVGGSGRLIKLSSNETPLGPCPKAVEAYIKAGQTLERYPDGSARALREAIAEQYDLDPNQVVCGAGSDELLNLLAAAYLGPGDEAIYTEHGFLVYKIAIMTNGATPVVAPETNFTADIDKILGKVTEQTKIVFLANPNNPTGTYCPQAEIIRLRQNLPEHVLLVLDGAYAEYVCRNEYDTGFELVKRTGNTVITRTFSKLYGLASLRIGWAYCPEDIADVLNRIRGPFNLSGPAIDAGVAAMQDQEHVEKAVAHNNTWLPWLSEEITQLGLQITPSVANFLLVHFPEDPEKNSTAANEFLLSKRIILRRLDKYGLPGALRLTVGKQEDNEAVVAAISGFMS